jgi:acetyl/propionyl-CoA carboxylase alpha subunit
VIGWGEDRQTAIRRLRRALDETQIGGIPTDIDFLKQIIDSESFIQGSATTSYLDTFQPVFTGDEAELEKDMALVAAILEHQRRNAREEIEPQDALHSLWRLDAWREQMH